MQLSDNALYILQQRYLLKNEYREIIESPEAMFRRVANVIASIESNYNKNKEYIADLENKFYKMMTDFDFLPNSPTLMNSGTKIGILSACFVLPVEDSIESIFDAVKNTALIHREGGGTGFSFTNLRPKNDIVRGTGGISSGPLSFMNVFDSATEVIKQGGKRRGANMGVMRIDHPDIFDFIVSKEKEGRLRNFNISVALTDEFMDAVVNDKDFYLINPRDKRRKKAVKARALWNLLVTMSWKNGEPGILFIDNINKYNPTPDIPIESTNPCVSGDSLIYTPYGNFPIKELVEHKCIAVYSWNPDTNKLSITSAENIRKTGRRKTILLKTTRGSIRTTPNHLVLTPNGWKYASNLRIKDKIIGFNKTKKGERWVRVGLSGMGYTPEHRIVTRYFYGLSPHEDVHHIDNNTLNNHPLNLRPINHGEHSRITNIGHKDWSIRSSLGMFKKKNKKKSKWQIPFNKGEVGLNWIVTDIIYDYKIIDVYNMETETKNFIANGMVVHNCGEQPLLSYESCNLGSINLSNFVKGNDIDWNRLEEIIKLSIRFLDNVIDANKYPLKQIEDMTKLNRKIGLGVMGWADSLLKLGIRYDSKKALDLADKLMKFIQEIARRTSIELGREKGNFPNKDNSIFKSEEHMRNATVTTIAPTGTISLIADCSSGIEPLFSIIVQRNVKESMGKNLIEINPAIKKSLQFKGLWNNELEKAIVESQCLDCTALPKDMKEAVVTSGEISPEWHVRMQSVFQKYTDNAVSKTVNLNNGATFDDVERIFLLAYELNCKGITIYRDGSRKYQLLVSKTNPKPISLTCSKCD